MIYILRILSLLINIEKVLETVEIISSYLEIYIYVHIAIRKTCWAKIKQKQQIIKTFKYIIIRQQN